MPEYTQPKRPSGRSASGSSSRLLRAGIKTILMQAETRPTRSIVEKDKKGWSACCAWLNYCFEQAADAHTLEDALKWQRYTVAALTDIINIVAHGDDSSERKRALIFDLMHARADHNRRIQNIEMAMRRNETLWR